MRAVAWGLLLPFVGTVLGAVSVWFLPGGLGSSTRRVLSGFAAGVMTAASVWSLLLPALEQAESWGRWSFFPAVVGFWAGILFLLALDRKLPALGGERGERSSMAMLVLAVILHNIPEGMAVGVAYAGWLEGEAGVTLAGALALSLGIAIQNIPEGAIISLPLRGEGMGRRGAFSMGVLSGIVEPIGGAVTIWLSALVVPALPFLLSFAAGAMIYVVVEELVPELPSESGSAVGLLCFVLGFTVMMTLDVALG